jgi:hypothetical protein
MHDDDEMDRLLTGALAARAPELSPGFDAAVMLRVRRRRLKGGRWAILLAYAIGAAVATAWLLRGLDLAVVAAGLAVGLPAVAGAGAYVRRLVQ